MKLTDLRLEFSQTHPKQTALLIGMVEDGPAGIPFQLTDPRNIVSILGENELSRTYRFLTNNGVPKENLYFYRLNGLPATLSLGGEESLLQLKSVGMSDEDNNLYATVSPEGLTVYSNYLSDRKDNFKRTYRFEQYPYLTEMAGAINQDAELGLVDVLAVSESLERCEEALTTGEYSFSGGDSEESLIPGKEGAPSDYFERYWPLFNQHVLGEGFSGDSFTEILKLPAEVLYFTDLPVEQMPEIGTLAAMVAQQKSEEQLIHCTALFHTGLFPDKRELREGEYMISEDTFYNTSTEEEEEYLPYQEQVAFFEKLMGAYPEEEREKDIYRHLKIVVGEDLLNEEELDFLPGSLHYLRNWLVDDSLHSFTNNELPLFRQLKHIFGKTDIASLQSKGYICIVPSVRRNFVATQEQFIAQKTDMILSEPHNQRIVGYISYDIHQLMERFIGNTKRYFWSKSVSKELEDYLRSYASKGVLDGFKVAISTDASKQDTEMIFVELALYGEVQSIHSNIRIETERWLMDEWSQKDSEQRETSTSTDS